MNKEDSIEVKALVKKYGSREVLRIPHWQVKKGRITGIIGPSGAGKSTLLRLINLLELPTAGQIRYDGTAVPKSATAKLALQRRMTMVFQKPALLNLTVFDNIAFGLRARHYSQRDVVQRVQRMLAQIGMDLQGQQKAKTLSGGEAQRVAFARAFVLEPEVLLLDEATANLDPANVEMLETLIRTLHQQTGTTVIMVTHNLFQARRLTDDTLFLNQGRLVESGATEQLFTRPQAEETKAFVDGRMIY
ncbi:MAG: phosphate ABC transporter ATP-binding protein [Firmicutes bacterium]|nr:phosphate ABC transporter ATP-binding protein [Bacillota bacterium]